MNVWSVECAENAPILIAQAHGEVAGETHTVTPAAHAAAAHTEEEGGHHVSPWVFFSYSMLAFLVLTILAIASTRRMRLIPRGLQNFMEIAVEGLYGIPEMVMGPRGRQYAPLIASLFLYIITMNLMGLIPFFKPGTASLSVTLGLAIVAFIAVQYYGFQTHGIKYLSHFAGPVPWLAFLILPLELVSEFIRPLSLSVRLYGNLFGEEQVVGALAGQIHPLSAVLFLPLQVLTSILQALVFTLLTTVYISLATEKHEEHEGAHASPETAPHPVP